MRMLHLSALLLALTVCLGASAQGKKKRPVTKPATPVQPAVKSQAQLLFDNMLPNTQQVFVIDSMVVEKNNFLAEIESTGKWTELYNICLGKRIGQDQAPEPPAIQA